MRNCCFHMWKLLCDKNAFCKKEKDKKNPTKFIILVKCWEHAIVRRGLQSYFSVSVLAVCVHNLSIEILSNGKPGVSGLGIQSIPLLPLNLYPTRVALCLTVPDTSAVSDRIALLHAICLPHLGWTDTGSTAVGLFAKLPKVTSAGTARWLHETRIRCTGTDYNWSFESLWRVPFTDRTRDIASDTQPDTHLIKPNAAIGRAKAMKSWYCAKIYSFCYCCCFVFAVNKVLWYCSGLGQLPAVEHLWAHDEVTYARSLPM